MPASNEQSLRRRVRGLASGAADLAERIIAELSFAEGLCGLHPRRAGAWRKLIARAWGVLARPRSAPGLKRAVADAEKLLAPVGKVARTYTVHCVGHGHIDMNWMWSWPETVAVTHDTFVTVLKLMEEFDDFCYTQSQASVYAIVRDYHPELLEPIRARVAEGRWEVAAAHWVEGDKNLACGESLARHLLYTRRFVRELFAIDPEDQPLDWEPDTFGHAITVPTIVSRAAVRRYYMCRGGHWDKPPVFWYRGPDGSRILVYLETGWYNGRVEPGATEGLLKLAAATGLRDRMLVYGVGDHGGGPTRRDIRRAREMNDWPIFPAFRPATTRDFYAILEAEGDRWPVVDRELNFEFTGCYTSQSRIKRNNRLGENHMLEAEAAAALAAGALGRPCPHEALRKTWIDVLFSHFHDILPGSGSPETRAYNEGMFQRIAASAGTIKTGVIRALASAVDTRIAGEAPAAPSPAREPTAFGAGAGRGAGLGGLSSAGHVADGPRPFVVFNPTAWPRREVVPATVWDVAPDAPAGDAPPAPKRFRVRTPDGRAAPAQTLGTGNYWGHRYTDLLLPVDVAAMSYAALAVEEGDAPDATTGVRCVEDPPRQVPFGTGCPTLENERLAVRFDPLTGGVVGLLDKDGGVDLADPRRPMAVLEYIRERPGGMSAWVIHETAERRCPLPVESLRNVRAGPHEAATEARLKLDDSTLTVTYVLRAGARWLEVRIAATWLHRGGPDVGTPKLRMRFPLALADARATYEVPFGTIRRDGRDGEEVPALRFADVLGRQGRAAAGCAVLNDGKHGHALDARDDAATLSVTLLRSSYEPDPLPEIGDHAMRLAIVPHAGRLPAGERVRLAAAFNHPLHVVPTDAHPGDLAPVGPAVVAARPDGVVVSSVRPADDGDGFIVHLHETAGRNANARVAVDDGLLGRVEDVVEVDLLERAVKTSTARPAGAGFAVRVPARGIAAVRVRTGR